MWTFSDLIDKVGIVFFLLKYLVLNGDNKFSVISWHNNLYNFDVFYVFVYKFVVDNKQDRTKWVLYTKILTSGLKFQWY